MMIFILFAFVVISNNFVTPLPEPLWSTGMATGRGRRITMEDRAGAWDIHCSHDPHPSYSVWAVFDGHGSAAVSTYLHAAMRHHLRHRLCAGAAPSSNTSLRSAPIPNPSPIPTLTPAVDVTAVEVPAVKDNHVPVADPTAASSALRGPHTDPSPVPLPPPHAMVDVAQSAPVIRAPPPAEPQETFIPPSIVEAPAPAPVARGTLIPGNQGAEQWLHRSSEQGEHPQHPGQEGRQQQEQQQETRRDYVRVALMAAFADLDEDLKRGGVSKPPQKPSEAGDDMHSGGDTSSPAGRAPHESSFHEDGNGSGGGAKEAYDNGASVRRLEGLRAAAAGAAWDAGSTAVVAIVDWTVREGGGAVLWVANIGNSRALLCSPPAAPESVGAAASFNAKNNITDVAAAAEPNSGSGAQGGEELGPSVNDRATAAGGGAGGRAAVRRASRRRARLGGRGGSSEGVRGGSGSEGVGQSGAVACSLTPVHELDDTCERMRVEAAGGRVDAPTRPGGKRRLMGDLEVSRALGDLQYRSVGLSAEPHVAGPWRLMLHSAATRNRNGLTVNNDEDCDCNDRDRYREEDCGTSRGGGDGGCPNASSGMNTSSGTGVSSRTAVAAGREERHLSPLLILASDGVLETMTPQDMCDHATAQLSGAVWPPLSPPSPPAIALGPTTSTSTITSSSDIATTTTTTPQAQAPDAHVPKSHHPHQQATSGSSAVLPTITARSPPALLLLTTSATYEDAADTDVSRGGGSGGGAAAYETGLAGCCDCDSGGDGSGMMGSSGVSKTEKVTAAEDGGSGDHQEGGRWRHGFSSQLPCDDLALSEPSHRRAAQRTVHAAAVRLVQEAVRRGSLDNVAAVVVRLPGTITASTTTTNTTANVGPFCTVPETITSGACPSPPPPVPQASTTSQIVLDSSRPPTNASSSSSLSPSAEAIRRRGGSGGAMSGMQPSQLPPNVQIRQCTALRTTTTTTILSTPAATPISSCPSTGLDTPNRRLRNSDELHDLIKAGSSSDYDVVQTSPSVRRSAWASVLSYGRLLLDCARRIVSISPGGGGLGYNGGGGGGGGDSGSRPGGGRDPSIVRHQKEWGRQSSTTSASAAVELVCSLASKMRAGGGQGGGGGGAGPSTARGRPGGSDLYNSALPSNHGGQQDRAVDQARHEGCDEDGEEVYDSNYSYLLAEKIAAVPSFPYHLHAALPGADALPPWRLSDFEGASTFSLPGLGCPPDDWLLDRLYSYYSRPHDAWEPYGTAADGTALAPSAGSVRECFVPGAPGGPGGANADVNSHALMSYGTTHSLLIELATIPLHLALTDTASGRGGTAATGTYTRSSTSKELVVSNSIPLVNNIIESEEDSMTTENYGSNQQPGRPSNLRPATGTSFLIGGDSAAPAQASRTRSSTVPSDEETSDSPRKWNPAVPPAGYPTYPSDVMAAGEGDGPNGGGSGFHPGRGQGRGSNVGDGDDGVVAGLDSGVLAGGGVGEAGSILEQAPAGLASERWRPPLPPPTPTQRGLQVGDDVPWIGVGGTVSGPEVGGSGGGGSGSMLVGAAGRRGRALLRILDDFESDDKYHHHHGHHQPDNQHHHQHDHQKKEYQQHHHYPQDVADRDNSLLEAEDGVPAVVTTVTATITELIVSAVGGGINGAVHGAVSGGSGGLTTTTTSTRQATGVAAATNSPQVTAVTGPLMHLQPRAHGQRQADGAVHIITPDVAGAGASIGAGAGADGSGGGGSGGGPNLAPTGSFTHSSGGSGGGGGGGGGARSYVPAPAPPPSPAAAASVSHVYRLRERFGQGHFGEVWRAWRLDEPLATDNARQSSTTTAGSGGGTVGGAGAVGAGMRGPPQYVLKRLRGGGGGDESGSGDGNVQKSAVLLSGLREAYFGDLLRRLTAASKTVGGGDAAGRRGPQDDIAGAGGGGSGGGGGGGGEEGSGEGLQGTEDPGCRNTHLVEFLESFEVEDPEGVLMGGPPSPHAAPDGSGGGGGGTDFSYASHGGPSDPTGPMNPGPKNIATSPDLWLVFKDAGRSLHDLIYSPIGMWPEQGQEHEQGQQGRRYNHHESEDQEEKRAGRAGGGAGAGAGTGSHFQVLGPSPWWHTMRRHPQGHVFIRGLLRQLLMGLQVVHEANITHRDVKPENMMLAPAVAVNQGSTPGTGGASACPSSSPSSSSSSSSKAPVADPGVKYPGRQASEQQGQRAHSPEGPTTDSSGCDVDGDGGGDGGEGDPRNGVDEIGVEDEGLLHNDPDNDNDNYKDNEDDNHDNENKDQKGGNKEGQYDDWVLAPVVLRLIDFGSAVDDYSVRHLYGDEGPTSNELTLEYAPPEALFGRYWEGMRAARPRAWAYDIWSVGVVWLELVLATPQVWQLPAATRALLEARLALRGLLRPEGERQLVFLLRGLMEWCIYPPQAPSSSTHGPPLRGHSHSSSSSRLLMSWSCTEEALLALARSRDPTGLGLEGPMALRLLLRILHWDPASRPSARQALQHAFFTVPTPQWPTTTTCGSVPMGERGWC